MYLACCPPWYKERGVLKLPLFSACLSIDQPWYILEEALVLPIEVAGAVRHCGRLAAGTRISGWSQESSSIMLCFYSILSIEP